VPLGPPLLRALGECPSPGTLSAPGTSTPVGAWGASQPGEGETLALNPELGSLRSLLAPRGVEGGQEQHRSCQPSVPAASRACVCGCAGGPGEAGGPCLQGDMGTAQVTQSFPSWPGVFCLPRTGAAGLPAPCCCASRGSWTPAPAPHGARGMSADGLPGLAAWQQELDVV